MLARRIAARFVTAEILTKAWIAGVRRGWLKTLDQKPRSWPEIQRAFTTLIQFVANLKDQVFFARRGPYTSLAEFAESKEVRKLFDTLMGAIKDEHGKAQHWQQVMEKTGLPGFPVESGEHMFALYQTNFEEAIDAKALTRTFDKLFKLLREDAQVVVDQDKKFPNDPYQDRSVFKEFDLYGMKVVIDENAATPGEIKQYIKYLDEAYQRMKQKGVAKAWYGTVFIKCDDCGGVNHNTGGGVGGNYHIGKDTVQVFSRPDPFIVELMAHELGHRFWFKQMSPTQRARFESLVRVHKTPAPGTSYLERTIGEDKRRAAHKAADDAVAPLRSFLSAFGQAKAKFWKEPINEFRDKIASAGWDAQNDLLTAMHKPGAQWDISPDSKAQFNLALETRGKLSEFCRNLMFEIEEEVRATPEVAKAPKNIDKYWWSIFEVVRKKWVEKAQLLVDEAVMQVYLYIDISVLATNEAARTRSDETRRKWEESWEQDARQVLPVSDYGRSNIDEAWAEVFAHYVLGQDMNRDQLESFKSVLKTASVVERYKQALTKTLDVQWVETMRKDFLTLMKNLPRVNDYATADKLQKAFAFFKKEFNQFVFVELLNPLKDQNISKLEALRKPAWDLYIELRLPLSPADGYNSEDVQFSRYQSDVGAWERRLKAKAQVFWKVVRETLDYVQDKQVSVQVPNRDRLVLEGFQVEILGYDANTAWQDDALSKFKEGLRQYRRKASKVLPWLIQHQLPLEIAFDSKLNEGGLYEGDHIRIAMSAVVSNGPEWTVHMLAHEMGHHLFKHLSSDAATFWDTAIRQDYGPLDLEKLLAQWPERVRWSSDFVTMMADKDPVLALQVDVLSMEHRANPLDTRASFLETMTSGTQTMAVPKHPITGYASKNPEESFCEAIGRLVGYGPATVLSEVRRWLGIAIPGMVKLAAVNSCFTGQSMSPKNVVARFKHEAADTRLEVGKWYTHKHLMGTFFLVQSVQKNGGWAGLMIKEDRAHPKAKKDSIRPGGLGSNQWTEIAKSEVPEPVQAAVSERN
jgi:hypothetical protein